MSFKEIKEFVETLNNNGNDELINFLISDKRKNVQQYGMKIKRHIEDKLKEIERVKSLYDFDKKYISNGYLAGVDEVGRGPLAGPIVAAAVILKLDYLNDDELILGINDSKKLSIKKRIELAEKIKKEAISYNISVINNGIIDEKGIGWCNQEVLKSACEGLEVVPNVVVSDGYPVKNLKIKNEYVIKGDSKSASIGCASIVAKVYRDQLMEQYSKEYPFYNFQHNAGYGSQEHIAAIKTYGPCILHRRSFLKNIL